jgi:hypothetical protein
MKMKHSLSLATMLVVAVNSEVCISTSAQTNSTNIAIVPARSFLGMGGVTTIPERKASPHFLGTKMPQPPEQDSAWSIPASSLPANYVSATALLFEQGMAVPRGCDYREIEVGTGDVWQGDGGIVKTHGWILPSSGEQKFAVCWNGLVYPVVSLGDAADWRADVQAAMKNAGRQWRSALPEAYEVSYETARPIKGCLILRLGDAKLAEEFWLAIQAGAQRDLKAMYERSGVTNSSAEATAKLDETDPYLNWASDWAWDLFERAVCAHMRGDDHLALLSSRLLTSVRPKIEKETKHRGFQDRESGQYLGFLDPLPTLLADQERRAQNKQPMPIAEIVKLTNQTIRISMLVEQVDEIAVRQWGQPGGLGSWNSDPVAVALLKEGPGAIEPLLQCLESDCSDQLTRSVSFGRDFHRNRTFHPVSEPIVNILIGLMNASDATIGIDRGHLYYGDVSKADLVALFRNYWKEFGELPLSERWYRKLADDNAETAAWSDALDNIVHTEKPATGNTNETKLAGESLRTKASPSVTELLLRRCLTMARSRNPLNAVGFALNIEKWEAPPALLVVAREVQEKVLVGDDNPQMATSVAAIAMLRARHGDVRGLDDFAAWIQASDPGSFNRSVVDVLEPFWQFPNQPSLRRASRAMFGNANSAWGTSVWMFDTPSHSHNNIVGSPVLVIPEARHLVLRELANRTVEGEALNRGSGNLEIKYADGGTENSFGRMNTEGMEVGAKSTFRRCDIVAEQLSAIPGFPKINLLWSERRRDEAVAATVKLLKSSGNRLRVKDKPSGWSSSFGPPLVELSKE